MFDIAVLASESVAQELSVAREMIKSSNIPFLVADCSGIDRSLVKEPEGTYLSFQFVG